MTTIRLMDRNELIEHLGSLGMGYGLHPEMRKRVLGEWADAILRAFEEAQAPSGDEREALLSAKDARALAKLIDDVDEGAFPDQEESWFNIVIEEREQLVRRIMDWIHSAGFRRPEAAEACSCRGEYVSALDIVDGCKCGRLKPFDQMTDDECNAAATAQGEPSDALIEEALAWIGRAWDDGNGSGLDGWVGPGRGAGEVDREAQHARTRLIHKAEAALRAAYQAERGEGRGEDG